MRDADETIARPDSDRRHDAAATFELEHALARGGDVFLTHATTRRSAFAEVEHDRAQHERRVVSRGRGARRMARLRRRAAPRTLAQIALAEQALGRFVDAEAHLREALAADDAFIRRHRRLLETARTEYERSTGVLPLEGDEYDDYAAVG